MVSLYQNLQCFKNIGGFLFSLKLYACSFNSKKFSKFFSASLFSILFPCLTHWNAENIPELKNLKGIDLAFLPMNLPYTMTPAMVVDAVNMFNPKIIYSYHTGNTDVNK